MRPSLSGWAVCLVAVFAAAPAAPQSWSAYRYPEVGFAIQFPGSPTVTTGLFKGPGGVEVPATTYGLEDKEASYSMVVADFSQTPVEAAAAAIEGAVKDLGAAGEVKLNVAERVGRQYGRQLSVHGPDGSRSMISVFVVDRRLFQLVGKALPPPEAGLAKALRFQQSLEFPGAALWLAKPRPSR